MGTHQRVAQFDQLLSPVTILPTSPDIQACGATA
jgi:hypothetical protein